MDAGTADHSHFFLGPDLRRNERRTWLVFGLTAAAMAGEIAAGSLFGSMALVADGWHMSTHAAAMAITALAYLVARRHADDPRYSFGTGRLGDIAAFASAVVLALVAVQVAWESLHRLAVPVPIQYGQALLVAVLGLAVNLASAWLLRGHDGHEHGHHGDNNLRAAYLHVMADALTSVLAIAALLAGRVYGWSWLDPLMGLVGAAVVARWSWGLMRDSGGVLVGLLHPDEELPDEIRAALETGSERITDLHVWQVGPGHHAAIVAIATARPLPPDAYKARLAHLHDLSHVTVEVRPLAPA